MLLEIVRPIMTHNLEKKTEREPHITEMTKLVDRELKLF